MADDIDVTIAGDDNFALIGASVLIVLKVDAIAPHAKHKLFEIPEKHAVIQNLLSHGGAVAVDTAVVRPVVPGDRFQIGFAETVVAPVNATAAPFHLLRQDGVVTKAIRAPGTSALAVASEFSKFKMSAQVAAAARSEPMPGVLIMPHGSEFEPLPLYIK